MADFNTSTQKTEQIGKVTLDLSRYPGEDYYCDGEIEDELLDIVKNHAPEEFPEIIEQRASWPVLYHLSYLRENIMDWFPIKEGSKVLEIGAGCGAITGKLSEAAGSLTCIDLSKKRSMINAYRHKDRDNICIKVGNFQDIEPELDTDYDLICLIGVFEYAKGYQGGAQPYQEFLKRIRRHCRKGGQIVIAIENRLGLKYFAGCREDHLGDFGSGIEDYPSGGVVRTFSRPALEQIFRDCGEDEVHFYYPYPDYKFPAVIYSDVRLPAVGELTNNLRNFDRSRLMLFDEKNAFDSLIRDGQFPLFSNSYFAVLGPAPNVIYSKFSNDRTKSTSIRTDIYLEDGEKKVRKAASFKEAAAHLENLAENAQLLQERFDGSGLEICPCSMQGGEAQFPYLPGTTLEEMLDQCLECGDKDRFQQLLKKYCGFVKFRPDSGVTDYDLIFPNILVSEDGTWQVIDYEWTVREEIDPEKVIKRSLYCYRLGSEKRRLLDMEELCASLGLGSFDEEAIAAGELAFQKTVTGSRSSMSEMLERIGNQILSVDALSAREEQRRMKKQVQVYYDDGSGFSEENSVRFFPAAQEEYRSGHAEDYKNNMGARTFSGGEDADGLVALIPLHKETNRLRLDPAMQPCLVQMEKMVLRKGSESEEISLGTLPCSGGRTGRSTYVFADNDPNLILPSFDAGRWELAEVHYALTFLPEAMASELLENSRLPMKSRVKKLLGRSL